MFRLPRGQNASEYQKASDEDALLWAGQKSKQSKHTMIDGETGLFDYTRVCLFIQGVPKIKENLLKEIEGKNQAKAVLA